MAAGGCHGVSNGAGLQYRSYKLLMSSTYNSCCILPEAAMPSHHSDLRIMPVYPSALQSQLQQLQPAQKATPAPGFPAQPQAASVEGSDGPHQAVVPTD